MGERLRKHKNQRLEHQPGMTRHRKGSERPGERGRGHREPESRDVTVECECCARRYRRTHGAKGMGTWESGSSHVLARLKAFGSLLRALGWGAPWSLARCALAGRSRSWGGLAAFDFWALEVGVFGFGGKRAFARVVAHVGSGCGGSGPRCCASDGCFPTIEAREDQRPLGRTGCR